MMKRMALALALAVGVLAVPSIASAHTGWVDCTPQGVTFHYNANFEQSTTVTEIVRPTDTAVKPTVKTALVQRFTASTDTVPVFGDVTAWAMWKIGHRSGQIKPVHLNCVAPPPPVAPPPVVTTPPPVTPVVTTPPPAAPPATTPPPAAPVATPAVTPAVTPKTSARCPKGTLDLGIHGKVKMCLRVVRVPAKKKASHHATKPAHKKATKPKFHGAGVTG